ncbi:MAG: replication-associated recombination protein A [Candidatus Omnitrophota bacterium]
MPKKNTPDISPDLFGEGRGAGESASDLRRDPDLLPLAVRMRPAHLDDIVGQSHILAPGKILRRVLQADRLQSLLFYGPSGSGKTTLALVIAKMTQAKFISLNAVEAGVSELRAVIQAARQLLRTSRRRTVLFIDEIHRFNRAQQDVLMPDVEHGVLILIGATTQNPSFAVNAPLLSRAIVFELRPLGEPDLRQVLFRALNDPERGYGKIKVRIEEEAVEHLVQSALGDARKVLNALEVGIRSTTPDQDGVIHFDRKVAEESCQKKWLYHDKAGDYHYDAASAFIKSMRGSSPDAAIYWLAKMLDAGEDPRFIMRRILILASEDIGNADPQALILAASAMQAIEFVGMPEARIILAHAVVYMALAPKSNAAYMALEKASADIQNHAVKEVPAHLRDSSTSLSKKLGHGQGYQYVHHFEGGFVPQEYLPDCPVYYVPTDRGFEKTLADRLKQIRK